MQFPGLSAVCLYVFVDCVQFMDGVTLCHLPKLSKGLKDGVAKSM